MAKTTKKPAVDFTNVPQNLTDHPFYGFQFQKDVDDKTDAFMKYLKYFKRFEDSGDERVAVCELTKNYRGWVSQMADALEL